MCAGYGGGRRAASELTMIVGGVGVGSGELGRCGVSGGGVETGRTRLLWLLVVNALRRGHYVTRRGRMSHDGGGGGSGSGGSHELLLLLVLERGGRL